MSNGMNESDGYLFSYEKVFQSPKCMSELTDRKVSLPIVLST